MWFCEVLVHLQEFVHSIYLIFLVRTGRHNIPDFWFYFQKVRVNPPEGDFLGGRYPWEIFASALDSYLLNGVCIQQDNHCFVPYSPLSEYRIFLDYWLRYAHGYCRFHCDHPYEYRQEPDVRGNFYGHILVPVPVLFLRLIHIRHDQQDQSWWYNDGIWFHHRFGFCDIDR